VRQGKKNFARRFFSGFFAFNPPKTFAFFAALREMDVTPRRKGRQGKKIFTRIFFRSFFFLYPSLSLRPLPFYVSPEGVSSAPWGAYGGAYGNR
jgi:hypothetical protein